jgi:hypothetical protein
MKPALKKERTGQQGRARRENVMVSEAEKITCMRCIKLMAINRRVRGDDLAVGDTGSL